MVQNTQAKVKTYALHTLADFHCRIIEKTFEGMQLQIDHTDVWTPFIGVFNAYNLLLVYATAQLLGVEKSEALRLLSTMRPVTGRFETVRTENGELRQAHSGVSPLSTLHSPLSTIVDYAHTPDALQNVLDTINDIRHEEQLITVVGCGGNRDATKRPVMARIAADNSDKTIFTSDNPRFESPDAILADMKAGLDAAQRRKSLFITDRREAIRAALMLAASGKSIVLIAGKGHETYQEIKGERFPFDDKAVVRELLHELEIN
jgi:UDP-N-acetylmuramoyl-L-alanyl-D-glutamate--2,6-diaminopimelate ligase